MHKAISGLSSFAKGFGSQELGPKSARCWVQDTKGFGSQELGPKSARCWVQDVGFGPSCAGLAAVGP